MTELTWAGWLYLILTVWGVLYYVVRVGKPRGPITGGEAATALVVNALMVWALIAVGVAR